MNSKPGLTILLGVMCVLALALFASARSEPVFRPNIPASLDSIESRWIDLCGGQRDDEIGDAFNLFTIPLFCRLHEHPDAVAVAASAWLSSPHVNNPEAQILVYATARATLSNHLLLLDKFMDLYKAGKISPTTMDRAIFCGYDYTTTIPDNYKNPAVIAALKRAAALKGLQKYSYDMINTILSGEAARYAKECRDAKQIQ